MLSYETSSHTTHVDRSPIRSRYCLTARSEFTIRHFVQVNQSTATGRKFPRWLWIPMRFRRAVITFARRNRGSVRWKIKMRDVTHYCGHGVSRDFSWEHHFWSIDPPIRSRKNVESRTPEYQPSQPVKFVRFSDSRARCHLSSHLFSLQAPVNVAFEIRFG